ncbi:MAG: GNAT family N-acetyltransferase [Lysobacter sp.]|nr:GNAT family N-acetyltransferase [Lysobacter sp.]MDQ3269394.1 GNAT family N-acetyltransferase [Pseudomonadota bacterium]
MSDSGRFSVEAVDYAGALPDLRIVREAVFVQEQSVPPDLEWDELDPLCHHVLARDEAGLPIGTGRLTPEHRIGRMAVLAPWRGQGVGDALLRVLLDRARSLGWRRVSLHSQASAVLFYVRHGFLPFGDPFVEAGIDHQSMELLLDAPNPVETQSAALAAVLGVIPQARRELDIYSRELDPGLLDTPEVIAALRRFATAGGETRVLLQDAIAPQRSLAPMLNLAQRLPSAFAFRAIEEPADLRYPSAYAVNDRGGYYFRALGHRFDGETRLDGPARARQLRAAFDPVWERARRCTEYRALGI